MSIRFKLIIFCGVLLILNLTLGFFTLRLEQNLGDRAIEIYDRSNIGLKFTNDVQTGVIRFAASHPGFAASTLFEPARVELGKLISKLDVAIERAMTDTARRAGEDLKPKFQALMNENDPEKFAARLTLLDKSLEKLVRQFGEDGLDARDRIEEETADGQRLIKMGFATLLGLSLGTTVLLGWSVIPAFRRAVSVASAIAKGGLDTKIQTRGRGETATLMRALDQMQTAIRENLAQIDLRRAAEAAQREEFQTRLTAVLGRMAETVRVETASALDQVGGSSAVMRDHAIEMEQAAERGGHSAREAAAAVNEAVETARAFTAAAEDLTASITAINEQVSQSTQVVRRAVAASDSTRDAIHSLEERTARIGTVASMIGEIAARTNLLALNAAVEAARAGEAGKGFSIVAAEVKALAEQTARSTAEISRQIEDVRAATQASITAVTAITGTIAEVNTIAGSIAVAAGQQSAATQAIVNAVSRGTMVTDAMNERIADLAMEAGQTGDLATNVRTQAAALTQAVLDLRETVLRVVRKSTGAVNEQHMAATA